MHADATPGTTFRDALTEAAATRWSGVLEASAGDERVGSVVIADGELAWATCVYQPEDLGSFLYRLGHVTREELDEVRAEYERNGGRRKLGRLLEEAKLVSRPVLRRCLLLHVRMALACLLPSANLGATWRKGSVSVEDELLFPLREVLPEWQEPDSAEGLSLSEPGVCDDERTGVLARLDSISGYRGSIIAGRDGQLIAGHGFTAEEQRDGGLLATTAVTLMDGAVNTASWSGLGRVEYAYLEADGGSVLARWVDSEHRSVVAVFLGAEGRLGEARHRVAALEDELSGLGDVHDTGRG